MIWKGEGSWTAKDVTANAMICVCIITNQLFARDRHSPWCYHVRVPIRRLSELRKTLSIYYTRRTLARDSGRWICTALDLWSSVRGSNLSRDGHGSTVCNDSETVSTSHPCVTTVARERPGSSCQMCKWKITPTRVHTWAMTLMLLLAFYWRISQ